jgi:hypothetical protein
MKKQSIQKATLTLNKETIRQMKRLTTGELQRAHGGLADSDFPGGCSAVQQCTISK